ncbi:hypothetical protein BDV26DRAFT_280790 [Aspergillus bertholletiae]|uniref:Thioester reductase (TE) domain-containing protein n=1 Tax=Aspergillus bertholletiae TaxID=1226010 RepID=A0A5N7BAH8_9EURO|nr:hypothetical protein BDV26DRAFT_280790 [Aspergillus bertholletiae]
MLDALLRNLLVQHVHCLNRKGNAIDAVNFNLSLASFRPNLIGVVNLINFTHNATQSPHIFFISSTSSTMGHHAETGLTAEELITTIISAPNGYANSKYLAEHLLAHAAKQCPLHVSFACVGQIAGPAQSRVDFLAEVLADLALSKHKAANDSVNVFHPVNLHPLAWEAIRPIHIQKDIEMAGASGEILHDEELQALVARNPAVRPLGFFEEMMSQATRVNVLDTQLTAQRSEKLQAVEAIKPEWIEKWVGEWVP